MPAADVPENGDEVAAAVETAHTMVKELVAARTLYEGRARAWVSSPELQQLYEELHAGLFVKVVAVLLGRGNIVVPRSPRLWAKYQRLATDGELVFAATVVANSEIFSAGKFRRPAALIASREQDAMSLIRMAALASNLAEAYAGGSSDTPKCQAIIRDDSYRPLKQVPLPSTETGFDSSALYHVRLSAAESAEAMEFHPFLPLLLAPGDGLFLVVPWHVVLNTPTTPSAQPPGLPPPLPS